MELASGARRRVGLDLAGDFAGRVLHGLRLFRTLLAMRYKTQMMYPTAYYSFMFAKAVGYASEYGVILLLMERFKALAGWSLPELLIIHSLNVVSYTIGAAFFFHVLGHIDRLIAHAELDYVLTKPVHPLLWLCGYYYTSTYASQTLLGLGVLVVAGNALGLSWTPSTVAGLALVLLGASFLQAALLLGAADVCFWTVRGRNIARLVLGFRDFVAFPVSIYGPVIRLLLTFLVPVAFLNYYPAGWLLGREEYSEVPVLVSAAPAVGVGLFVVALLFWNRGLRVYSSAGS